MKFAKAVFWIAALFGFVSLAPLYFLFDLVGRLDPPPITHPQFYYGFAGLGLVWQFVFMVIATDPGRFRPMMIPAVLEKASYVGALLALYLQDRISPAQAATGAPDAVLGVLFLIAFLRIKRSADARSDRSAG
ncbi:MAG TPA: hypothetical protein VKR61_18100 [Bryobacteraceae bacterium]|nr:hypothetical protein [Bryobacteraceae bacterium]